jgi:NAD(P)-dependent dehydrogenase (short-subunit alcohol dehydrogenase family)
MIPPEWDLSGKAALVTSDSRGWSAILVGALAEAGASIAVVGPDADERRRAVEAAQALGGRAVEVAADLTASDQVRAAVQETVTQLGALDILVNASQVEFFKPADQVTDEEWDQVMARNARSMFLCCREGGKVMLERGGGRIVNIISGLSERGLINGAAYCASQGAALQLTRALAMEWARRNIRVNAIATGWYSLDDPPAEEAQQELLARYIPSRRKGHPRDIGALLVYLASDACDFVTGACIPVDGGLMAHA